VDEGWESGGRVGSGGRWESGRYKAGGGPRRVLGLDAEAACSLPVQKLG